MSMQNNLLKEALGKRVKFVLSMRDGREFTLHRGTSIALAFQTFQCSETCYRYGPVLSDENEEIADWLERLTENERTWGFGLCFLIGVTCRATAGAQYACSGSTVNWAEPANQSKEAHKTWQTRAVGGA